MLSVCLGRIRIRVIIGIGLSHESTELEEERASRKGLCVSRVCVCMQIVRVKKPMCEIAFVHSAAQR